MPMSSSKVGSCSLVPKHVVLNESNVLLAFYNWKIKNDDHVGTNHVVLSPAPCPILLLLLNIALLWETLVPSLIMKFSITRDHLKLIVDSCSSNISISSLQMMSNNITLEPWPVVSQEVLQFYWPKDIHLMVVCSNTGVWTYFSALFKSRIKQLVCVLVDKKSCNFSLSSAKLITENDNEVVKDSGLYRSMVGVCPKSTSAITDLCQFIVPFTGTYNKAAKLLVRCLKGALNYVFLFVENQAPGISGLPWYWLGFMHC